MEVVPQTKSSQIAIRYVVWKPLNRIATMENEAEKLLDLAFRAEKRGDRVEAIQLYRKVANGGSEHALYARNCADDLEKLGVGNPRYLIGGGSCNDFKNYHLVVGETRVSLAPQPMARARSMMLTCNCLFLAFFAMAIYLVMQKEQEEWVYYFLAALAFFTCVIFNAVVHHKFRSSNRRGEILVYDKSTGKISLPDHGLDFAIGEDIHIECITARESDDPLAEFRSELNFVSSVDGAEKRWNLLSEGSTINPFGKLTKSIAREIPIPVRRV
jgi:hypothetical protein